MPSETSTTTITGMLQYYPGYDDSTADVVLESADGVQFRAHSLLLRLASDVFEGMVSVPRPACSWCANPKTQTKESDVVILSESASVVAGLLDFVHPRKQPPALVDFEFVRDLADAADKYDFSDVTNAIRAGIRKGDITLGFGSGGSLLAYSIAHRHGWTVEAETLFMDALDITITPQLITNIGSELLLKFSVLRQRRWRELRDALTFHFDQTRPDEVRAKRLRWEEVASDHLAKCRSQAYNRPAWNAFRSQILEAMVCKPSGRSLDSLCQRFWSFSDNSTNYKLLSDDKCTKCSQQFLSEIKLQLEVIRIVKDILPKELE